MAKRDAQLMAPADGGRWRRDDHCTDTFHAQRAIRDTREKHITRPNRRHATSTRFSKRGIKRRRARGRATVQRTAALLRTAIVGRRSRLPQFVDATLIQQFSGDSHSDGPDGSGITFSSRLRSRRRRQWSQTHNTASAARRQPELVGACEQGGRLSKQRGPDRRWANNDGAQSRQRQAALRWFHHPGRTAAIARQPRPPCWSRRADSGCC